MTENDTHTDATQHETGAGMGLPDVVAAAAHDLSAPLFSILGLTQLLLDDKAPDDATRREFLEIIHRQATQLARIVDDLRELSAVESGGRVVLDLEPVLPAQLVGDVLSRAKPLASQLGLSLDALILPDLPAVQTDRGRATQVLDNLVANALKFTPPGGQVRVSASAGLSPGFVRITVRDNGTGLPEGAATRVFERFYREQAAPGAGSGLGLYISRQLVILLGGSIGVASRAGEGSSFWIELPCVVSLPGAIRHSGNASTPVRDS